MTKEITKARILQEIEDRFQLRELIPEKFTLSEEVVLTYDVREHLSHWATAGKAVSVTGTGEIIIFTVPGNEKWHLSGYSIVFGGAGAYTVAGCYIARALTPSRFVYLDLTAAQSVSYTINLPKLEVLEPGDKFCVNIDGYTSTQTLTMYANVMEEEIR